MHWCSLGNANFKSAVNANTQQPIRAMRSSELLLHLGRSRKRWIYEITIYIYIYIYTCLLYCIYNYIYSSIGKHKYLIVCECVCVCVYIYINEELNQSPLLKYVSMPYFGIVSMKYDVGQGWEVVSFTHRRHNLWPTHVHQKRIGRNSMLFGTMINFVNIIHEVEIILHIFMASLVHLHQDVMIIGGETDSAIRWRKRTGVTSLRRTEEAVC